MGEGGRQGVQAYLEAKLEAIKSGEDGPVDLQLVRIQAQLLPGCTLSLKDCDIDALVDMGPYRFGSSPSSPKTKASVSSSSKTKTSTTSPVAFKLPDSLLSSSSEVRTEPTTLDRRGLVCFPRRCLRRPILLS